MKKRNTNSALKLTLKHLGNDYIDAYDDNGESWSNISQSELKELVANKESLADFTSNILLPHTEWLWETVSDPGCSWYEDLYKALLLDFIRAGASKEILLWLNHDDNMFFGGTLEQPDAFINIEVKPSFIINRWDRRQKELAEEEKAALQKDITCRNKLNFGKTLVL